MIIRFILIQFDTLQQVSARQQLIFSISNSIFTYELLLLLLVVVVFHYSLVW